jgi:hypothetical protein
MSVSTLEQRVAALERELATLKQASANGGKIKDWRSMIGFFGNDQGMIDIFEHAMKLREKEREKVRRLRTC